MLHAHAGDRRRVFVFLVAITIFSPVEAKRAATDKQLPVATPWHSRANNPAKDMDTSKMFFPSRSSRSYNCKGDISHPSNGAACCTL